MSVHKGEQKVEIITSQSGTEVKIDDVLIQRVQKIKIEIDAKTFMPKVLLELLTPNLNVILDDATVKINKDKCK